MTESPEGFDLAALLAPIPGEAPAGRDLREDNSPDALYFRLRDARREASAAERAADAPRDEMEPRPLDGPPVSPLVQWRLVDELATEALAQHSKDLEIAAWLTEALLRESGLVGLTAGFRLLAGLVDSYWDGLFPLPDEEGIATRIGPVSALNGVGREGTLIQPLRKLVLFERPLDKSPVQLWQYELSAKLAGAGNAEQQQANLEARGLLPLETIETEALAARESLAALRDQVNAAAEAWQTLGRLCDAHCGADGPPTGGVRNVLDQIRIFADRFGAAEPSPSAAEAPEAAVEPASPPREQPDRIAAPTAGPISSREEALRTLAQIAEFFRRTEPHSPLAYTLQEAVRRGRMTWPELLAEIVPDAASRSAILSSLGIRPPADE